MLGLKGREADLPAPAGQAYSHWEMELGVPSLINNGLSLGIRETDPAWQVLVMDVLTDKYERRKHKGSSGSLPNPGAQGAALPAV